MTQVLPTLTEKELTPSPSDSDAGFGALSTSKGPLPLKAMDVRVRLEGLLARLQLTQTFVNTHGEPIEATYIFPLPDRAGVTRFRMTVAGRVIEGQLKERGEARREYTQAIRDGHRAAITEEERPGVFTLRVGNLPAGESATVELTLAGPIAYADGEATFRFPFVVAPRYVPGSALPGPFVGDGVASDTDAVPDASRISPPVLLPGFPNPVRLSLAVEIPHSSLVPYDVRSSLHTVVEEESATERRLRLLPGERLNRDFILRYRLAEERIQSALTLHPDAEGKEGTFLLTLVPPQLARETVRARDVVFVLDRSGSMSGWKMVAARRAVERMVETLKDHDRFTVLAFDDRVETPTSFTGDALTPGGNTQRYQASQWLATIQSRGGTEMAQPLHRAVELLTQHHEEDGRRDRIVVLITDGQVGNEDQILRDIGQHARKIRIFTLGIDRAVNAAFLRRLSDIGGGASELVETEERLEEVMDRIHRQIGTAVLTGISLEAEGLSLVRDSISPSRLPDLFAGTPLVVMGRYTGSPEGTVMVRAGDATGGPISLHVKGRRDEKLAIGSVWARARLRDLEDRYVIQHNAKLERMIVELSLRFNVLCRFTAYVAVDRDEVVNKGGQSHTIVQPVEQPEGWEAKSTMYGAMLSAPLACAAPSPPASLACKSLRADDMDEATRARKTRSPQANWKSQAPARDMAPPPPPVPCSPAHEEAHRFESHPTEKEGFFGRLKRWFLGGEEEASNTHDDLLRQAEDIRRAMAGASPDVAVRVQVLRRILQWLESFLRVARPTSETQATINRLNELLPRLRQLLAKTPPLEAEVQNLWTEVEQAVAGVVSADDRQSSFWK